MQPGPTPLRKQVSGRSAVPGAARRFAQPSYASHGDKLAGRAHYHRSRAPVTRSRRFPSLAGRGAVCLRLQTRSLRASMSDSSNGNVRAGASSSPQREGGAGPAVAPPAAEGPSSTTDGKGRRKGNVE